MKTYEQVLEALADATRRRIFEMLRRGPRAVGELAAGLPVSRPAVSQHLRVMKAAGMVREQRRGTRHYYEIDPRGLEPLRRYLEEFWGEVLGAFETATRAKNGGSHDS